MTGTEFDWFAKPVEAGGVRWTVHAAADPDRDAMVQRCRDCGVVLRDKTLLQRDLAELADTGSALVWYAVGARVGTDGIGEVRGLCYFEIGDRPLQPDEQPCTREVGDATATPES
ncbi:hypothetical protein [Saccharothrix hoggarensis]|uniref:Uncharacterized protein n=1 Tax=Saccharothrix hoggarensis TaxID=913853 RepID=A0ABW3QIP3_9PSEU